MKIKALKCPKCGDLVYSRARHDFRSCSCHCVSVDGGFDYCKYSVKPEYVNRLEFVDIEVEATKTDLYVDWNRGKGKFGLIKGPSKIEKFAEGKYNTKGGKDVCKGKGSEEQS